MIAMRTLPAIGPRYWTAIALASVFGANLGDFVSHDLHLGHLRGLAPLALIFTAIVLAERRSPSGREVFYWLAIVTLRTAATNLADLATHDARLATGWVVGGLTAALCAILLSGRAGAKVGPGGLPANNAAYWVAMFVAGTLGTALGDGVTDGLGEGPAIASVPLAVILAGLLALRAPYWLLIVAIRTTGTTVGDATADLFGLPLSTLLSGLLFAATLLLWSPRVAPWHRLWSRRGILS
jgi:uncharacterized membrane-anchored protein